MSDNVHINKGDQTPSEGGKAYGVAYPFLRELRRMATQPIYWFCMVIAPLFCYIFFTSLMKQGLPENLPMGLVD